MTLRRLALTTVAVLGLLPAQKALAESSGDEESSAKVDSSSKANPLATSSIGVKLMPGADLWNAPSNVPPNIAGDTTYTTRAAGFGIGGLAFYDWNIQKTVGLEFGLALQNGTIKHMVTYPSMIRKTETITTKGLRVPILLKLNFPTSSGRVWIGAGPEFTAFQWSSAKLVSEGSGGDDPELFNTKRVWPIFATVGAGMVIQIADTDFEIPIDLRASMNLTQPANWADRVTEARSGQYGIVRAESSWVFRAGVGVGYRF